MEGSFWNSVRWGLRKAKSISIRFSILSAFENAHRAFRVRDATPAARMQGPITTSAATSATVQRLVRCVRMWLSQPLSGPSVQGLMFD